MRCSTGCSGSRHAHDLDIDLHVDETNDPRSAALPYVARAALPPQLSRPRHLRPLLQSARCSPTTRPNRRIDLLAEAERHGDHAADGQPLSAGSRQAGRTPRWRGVTLVHEMRKRGIAVAAAGDNCRDCFYAYGDHDMIDTFRQAVRILHLDHPLAEAPALVGPAPAASPSCPSRAASPPATRRG